MLEFGFRIGELMVGQGLLDEALLEQALSAQLVHGGRIGTNLVELGAVGIDTLAAALGEQHGVPVADPTLLNHITSETLRIVPKQICSRYGVLPLRYESPSQLHLAMLDPQKLDMVDEVGAIIGVAVVIPYLVPELRLHHFLEVHHQIPRPKRFLRYPVDAPEVPDERRNYLKPTVGPSVLPPLDLPMDELPPPETQEGGPEGRTTGDFEITLALDDFEEESAPAAPATAEPNSDDDLLMGFDEAFSDEAFPDPGPPTLPPSIDGKEDDFETGFDSAFSQEFHVGEDPEPHHEQWNDLETAVDRIEEAADREELIDLLLEPLVPEAKVSLLFLVRDDMAVALGARGTDLSRKEVSTLVVPITMSAPLCQAMEQRNVVKLDARGDAMQQIVANFLGRPLPREACLVPINFEGKVVNLLCVQSDLSFSEESLETLALVSVTASHTYGRLRPRMLARATTQEVTPAVPPPEDSVSTSISSSVSGSTSMTLDDSLSSVSDAEPPPPEEDGSRPARQLRLIPPRQRKFGRYTLICRLASGGMANLYLAQLSGKEGFEKLVAIKRIHEHLSEEQDFIRMFIDEARLVSRISHPNVAQVIELDRFEETHFIAMEYVDGEGLHALLRRTKPKLPLIARIIAHTAAGLHAAHELQDQKGNPMGVVHRDVSPQNILISYQGAVKVVDFGVARARGNLHETNIGTVKGKLAYMSPEQVQSGPVDRRSDVFALGIVLYEATTFRRLFKGETEVETMRNVVESAITPPTEVRPDYPAELEKIVMTALQRDRTKRYQSAEELQAALEMYIMGSGSLVLASALGKLMNKTFKDNIAEKRRVLAAFEVEQEAEEAGA